MAIFSKIQINLTIYNEEQCFYLSPYEYFSIVSLRSTPRPDFIMAQVGMYKAGKPNLEIII